MHRFRGNQIGEQLCPSCKGQVLVKVFSCRLHSACSEVKAVWPEQDGRYRVCATCPDRVACVGVTKTDWILSILQSVNGRPKPVACLDHLPPTDEFDLYWTSHEPVLFPTLPLPNWDDLHLIEKCGSAEIELQADRESDPNYEINSVKHKSKMRFADFIHRASAGPSNDLYVTANNAAANRLALAPLLDEMPAVPGILGDSTAGFYWHGAESVVTPTHHDLTSNLLVMVRGRKRVLLVPPTYHSRMYNHVHVFSQVDLERPDFERFPLFRGVPVTELIIERGQALFVPCGWWHHVRSMETSIMVSYTNFVGHSNDFYKTFPR